MSDLDADEEGTDEEQLLHKTLPVPSPAESEAESSGPDEEEAGATKAADEPNGAQSQAPKIPQPAATAKRRKYGPVFATY